MSDHEKPCVILIEDNPADVQLLRFALEEAGMDCDMLVITDGLEALNWVRPQSESADPSLPDLAVVDLNLPRHDGIEILDAIQRSPKLALLPVLVLSSSPSPRDVARVRSFPNTRYMTKPSVLDDYAGVTNLLREMLAGGNTSSNSAGSSRN